MLKDENRFIAPVGHETLYFFNSPVWLEQRVAALDAAWTLGYDDEKNAAAMAENVDTGRFMPAVCETSTHR